MPAPAQSYGQGNRADEDQAYEREPQLDRGEAADLRDPVEGVEVEAARQQRQHERRGEGDGRFEEQERAA